MNPIDMIDNNEFNRGTQIKVIGVGGGGSNAVEHMIESGVQGIEFICANTDAQALNRSTAGHLIQLGATGLGAGSRPERGREAAEVAISDIRNAIQGAHMLFITAGMGGGTGTGAAPVIARVAKDMGILTVGVVTKPFDFEGGRRMLNAEAGLAELEANVDSLIVVLNDKLLEVLGDEVTHEEALAEANNVLKNAVGGIAEVINVEGLINVDFEDVRTVMSETGKAMMGTAIASGQDRARIAAEQAVACPLLDGVDMKGAKGVLVLISGSKASLRLAESRQAMNTIRAFAAEDAHVIYGAAYDESLGDALRVTVVATGLSRASDQQPAPHAHQGHHTHYTQPGHRVVSGQSRQAVPGAGFGAPPPLHQQSAPVQQAGPAVWGPRTGRTPMGGRVDPMGGSNMEEYEIPTYLRRQSSDK